MINATSMKNALRNAKSRIGIRRSQKMNSIAKAKKEILAKLEANNETLALITVTFDITLG